MDNVCKAKLDNAALRLQSESDATLAIVGFSETTERNAQQLAQNRANNVRTYLTQKGIAASRLDVRTGAGARGSEYRRVDLHLVPRGATFTGASVFPKMGEAPERAANRSPVPKLAVAQIAPQARAVVTATLPKEGSGGLVSTPAAPRPADSKQTVLARAR